MREPSTGEVEGSRGWWSCRESNPGPAIPSLGLYERRLRRWFGTRRPGAGRLRSLAVCMFPGRPDGGTDPVEPCVYAGSSLQGVRRPTGGLVRPPAPIRGRQLFFFPTRINEAAPAPRLAPLATAQITVETSQPQAFERERSEVVKVDTITHRGRQGFRGAQRHEPAPPARPSAAPGAAFKARSLSRAASRSAMVRRLSRAALPLPRAKASFA